MSIARRFPVCAAVFTLVFSSQAVLAESAPSPWSFMADAQGAVGQYFFNDSAGSANGYGALNLEEARSFSPASGFYLEQHSLYNGFKQVNELAGGGTLFQQSLDDSVGGTWIERYDGGWSLKPHVAVENELFRETVDETWGNGLYDYWRYNGGLTLERQEHLGPTVPWTWSVSLDEYYIHYPHFQSLASQFGAALAAPNPGQFVLDSYTTQFTVNNDFQFPGFVTGTLMYSLSLVNYPDQRVVNSADAYPGTYRNDYEQTLSGSLSKRLDDLQSLGRVRLTPQIGLTFTDLESNQNNFDTNESVYVPHAFSYWETHLQPGLTALFLKPMITVTASYDFGYRDYTGRLAQNADGTYQANRLYQINHAVVLQADYPLVDSLDFFVKGTWSQAISNTAYDQIYTYSYHDYDYFVGLSWRFGR